MRYLFSSYPSFGSAFQDITSHVFSGFTVPGKTELAFQQPGKARCRVHGYLLLTALLSCCAALTLSGCGANYTVTAAGIGSFQASTNTVEFGTVSLGQVTDSSITLVNQSSTSVQVSDLKITGNYFAVASPTTLPISVAANSTYSVDVQFKPKAAGDSVGQLTISSTSTTSPSLKIKLHGKGGATTTNSPALSTLTCVQSAYTGAGGDACTVTLTTAAGTGGFSVSLSSNNSAVTVPASVTVPAGSSSSGFTATVASVTSAQNATLTASAGGTTQTYTIGLGAYVPGVTLSSGSINFGSITINTTSTAQTVTLTSSGSAPLTVNSIAVSGTGFNVSGLSFPTTLNPGQTVALAVTFTPTTTGTANGTITLSDNASPGTATVTLSGTGQVAAGVLSTLACATKSFTGAGSDTCTVSLSAGAGSGGLMVALASNDSAVAVPASITVPSGSSSATFTASVSSVTTAQNATLTASAGGVTKTYAISLGAAVPALTIGTTSISFGSVNLNSPATQSVALTSSGTAALTVSAGTVTGSGFSISGISYPLTLNPGQSTTLYVQFDPTTAGAVSGTVTLTTNASPSTMTISISGTGVTVSHQVILTWNAPSTSTVPVAGYNIYRASAGSSSYQLMNAAVDVPTNYTDSTVKSGTSYAYYVESVDAQGNQSAPSNTFSVNIP